MGAAGQRACLIGLMLTVLCALALRPGKASLPPRSIKRLR
jgi:hypothetical protein